MLRGGIGLPGPPGEIHVPRGDGDVHVMRILRFFAGRQGIHPRRDDAGGEQADGNGPPSDGLGLGTAKGGCGAGPSSHNLHLAGC